MLAPPVPVCVWVLLLAPAAGMAGSVLLWGYGRGRAVWMVLCTVAGVAASILVALRIETSGPSGVIARGSWLGLAGLPLEGILAVDRLAAFALPMVAFLVLAVHLDAATSREERTHRCTVDGGTLHLAWLGANVALLSGGYAILLLGWGLGSFARMDVLKELAHNDYLRVLFELGVLGLLTYLTLAVGLVIQLAGLFRRRLSNYLYGIAVAAFSVAVVFMISSAINNILFRPVLQWYFWALMAAALKGARLEEDSP